LLHSNLEWWPHAQKELADQRRQQRHRRTTSGPAGEEHKDGVNYPICLIITLLHTRLEGSFVDKSASFVPPHGMIIPRDDIIRWIYYHVVIMIIKLSVETCRFIIGHLTTLFVLYIWRHFVL
jgi:hypothetical protein